MAWPKRWRAGLLGTAVPMDHDVGPRSVSKRSVGDSRTGPPAFSNSADSIARIIWGGRISVRPAHERSQIECAAIAADKVFARRPPRQTSQTKVGPRFVLAAVINRCSCMKVLEELAHIPAVSFLRRAALDRFSMEKLLAISATTKLGNAKPQGNTLDIGAGALREQQPRSRAWISWPGYLGLVPKIVFIVSSPPRCK